MQQASQKRSSEDKFRDHLLKAQEEYRTAKDAVLRAQREIDAMPAVDGLFALRVALDARVSSNTTIEANFSYYNLSQHGYPVWLT
jgi:hypothetical protein